MAAQRTTCPACGKGNFTIWDNGSSKCWNCGASGKNTNVTVKPLRRSKYIPEIRNLYKELSSYYHSCLTTEARHWLYARGVSDYSINTLKLGYCPDETNPIYKSHIAKLAGLVTKEGYKPVLGGRVTFPFLVDDYVSDLWGRTLDKNNPLRYRGPNFSSYSRGADHAYCHNLAYKHTAFERVVITEGLIKAVVSNQYGIATKAYPGTTAYRNSTPPMQGQKQVICFDSQVDHRRELLTAIKREADRYPDPYIATLPLRGGKKFDLDDYILKCGIDDYRRVIDGALDYKTWKTLNRIK
jgi:hypothetical protein